MKTAKLRTLTFLSLLMLFAALAVSANSVNEPTLADDYVPDVTQRVARISSIDGDVQIRRKDSEVWEVAELNLPVVEGDEIVTDTKARVEIQFDAHNYLRLFGRSFMRIANLTDSGIAVSLSEGSLNVRIFEFDAEKQYFEIDAPRTTLALLEKGDYRVDAVAEEVTVAVRSGEGRVYLPDSGFLLKDGRLATVRIDGENAGLANITSARGIVDNFDVWTFELDKAIAERLENSNYDEYYDTDIYGAELLNDYGDWTQSDDYGYVWVPRSTAIRSYSNWTPYRYGSWRWVPPYGWTWVNYEPWGWATYHYGRWIYWNGRWCWSPYGAYRYSRSWWSPALVVMNWYGGYYSWYPLPYSYHYYNYNYHWWNNHHHHGNNGNTGGNTTAQPGARPQTPVLDPATISRDQLPTTAIVRADPNTFDRGPTAYRPVSPTAARKIFDMTPGRSEIPPLPTIENIERSATASRPITRTRDITPISTGATARTDSRPLSSTLNRSRSVDVRTRVTPAAPSAETRTEMPTGATIIRRPTGAVARPERTMPVQETPPIWTDREPITPVRRPSTPVSRPDTSRPSTPVRRPSAPVSRPDTSRPSTPVRRPSAPVSRPSTSRPSTPVRRPSTPVSRPSTSRPSTPVRRPSTPVSRPSTPRPSTPVRRPSAPSRSAPSKPASRPAPSKPSSTDSKKRDG